MSVHSTAEPDLLAAPGGDTRPRRAGTAVVLILLAALAVLGTLAQLVFAPPAARGADAPAKEFSAARAERHLEQIAKRPHPLGTADNERVRDYLVTTARTLGARVTVESGAVVRPDWGNPFPAGDAHNVVAKVPGTAPQTSGGKALLLVAHYDSVPTGPGAADNGAAVAAMLEAMRALKESGGVRNDVVFLFTDGEELGALGAEMFVRKHGVDGYGAVLNWEARGSSGPVMMFETSTGNGPLINAFAGASSRPVANSLAYEVYRRMPNGSDFTVFRDAGAAGLNAAFLHGFHDYHSVHDDTERLSADSMQHHGETILGLTRDLGSTDLRDVRGDDAVYFDLFARVLVHYPGSWALPLALLTLAALGTVAFLGARRATLRISGVLASAGAGLAAVVIALLLSFGLWQATAALRPELAALPLSEPYERSFFAAGFLVIAAAALLAAARTVRGRRPAELLAGALLLIAVLLSVVVLTVPGASYLLQWPLLAGVPALWWACRRGEDTGAGAWQGVALASLPPAVALVLFVPLVDSLLVALGIPLAAVAVAVAAIGGALLLPLLARLPRPGLSSAGAAVVAVALVGTGILRSDFSPAQPRPNALVYVQDMSEDATTWISADPEPDAWTEKVFGDDPERGSAADYFPEHDKQDVMRAKAPDLRLPAPRVRVTGDATKNGTRTLRFSVRSQRDAWRLQVRLPQRPVRACTLAGVRMDAETLAKDVEDKSIVFQYTGAKKAIELSCEIPAGTRLRVDVTDYTLGLPPAARAVVGPRPAGTMPVSFGFAPDDSAVVRRITSL
ncbi:M20/M25/M40 family metallo-hydrolase [Streptomyces sp. DSM 118878]